MDKVFIHSSPCLKYDLTKKNIKEFQIHYSLDYQFLETYYENNKKTFLETVYSYIEGKFSDVIRKQGIDFHYIESIRHPHIFIHLDLNHDTNQIIQKIINDLETQYHTVWIKQRIPKLMTLVTNSLNNQNNRKTALESYKDRYGQLATDRALHIYKDHVRWYYDEISFYLSRNKYDFQ